MPRPRTPTEKAKLTGAAAHDPQRFRDRSNPKASGNGIGNAPDYLPDSAKTAWGIWVKELPWLTYEDRGALEVVSLMRAHIIDGNTAELPASFFGNYRMAISCLGATPVDRSKVHVPDADEPADPFAAFDGKVN